MNSVTFNSLGTQNFTRVSEEAIQRANKKSNIKEEPISYKGTLEAGKLTEESEEVKFKKFFKAYDSHLHEIKSSGGRLSRFMKAGDTIDLAHIKGAKIYLDLNGDGKLRDSERLTLAQLANLDENNDGVLSKSDRFYKDIKVEFEGSEGEKKIIALRDLIDTLNLADYFDESEIAWNNKLIEEQRQALRRAKDSGTSGLGLYFEGGEGMPQPQKIDARKSAKGGMFFQESTLWINPITDKNEWRTNPYDSRRATEGLNPFAGINNKETFKVASEKKIDALFQAAGVKKGEWLDLRGTEALGISSEIFNLGYEKLDANNQKYIQKFNAQKRFGDKLYAGYGMHGDAIKNPSDSERGYYHHIFSESNKQSYEEILQKEFERWDKTYKKQENVRALENSRLHKEMKELGLSEKNLKLIESFGARQSDLEFTSLTGMSFNKENVAAARDTAKGGNLAASFADIDVVEAIKQDEDGGYVLKFDSGRTIKVKELFYQDEDTLKIEQQSSTLNARALEALMGGKSLKEYRA